MNTTENILSYFKLNSTPLKSAISRYEMFIPKFIFLQVVIIKLWDTLRDETKDIVYIGSEDKLPLIL